jgi:hypothetical protein
LLVVEPFANTVLTELAASIHSAARMTARVKMRRTPREQIESAILHCPDLDEASGNFAEGPIGARRAAIAGYE